MHKGYELILNDIGYLLVSSLEYFLIKSNPAYTDKGKPDDQKQKKLDEQSDSLYKIITGIDLKKKREDYYKKQIEKIRFIRKRNLEG